MFGIPSIFAYILSLKNYLLKISVEKIALDSLRCTVNQSEIALDCFGSQSEIAKALIASKANLEAINHNGSTALYIAAITDKSFGNWKNTG